MGLSSKKSKTTPWKPAEEPIKQGLAQTQQVYSQTAPMTQGVADSLGGIFDSYAAKVGQSNPMLQGTNAALARTMRGDFVGQNPGASTYSSLGGANDPSIGVLSGMTGARGTGNYGDYGSYASGYTPGGNYTGIGTGNPALATMDALSKAGPNAAMGGLSTLGAGGFVGGGNDYFKDVAAGKYLDSNPYLDSIVDRTMGDVASKVNNRFGASGVGFGLSTDHSGLLTRELANASNAIRGQAYEAERGRMGEAAGVIDAATRGDRSQQLQALGLLGDTDARDRAMGLDAADAYGSLYNQGEGLRFNAQQAIDAQGRDAFNARLQGASLGLDATREGDAAAQAEYDGRARVAGLLSDAWRGQGAQQLAAGQAGDAAWNAERGRMLEASGQVPGLAEADYAGISPLLALSGGLLSAPWAAASNYNANISQLASPYSSTMNKGSIIDNVQRVGNIFTNLRGY